MQMLSQTRRMLRGMASMLGAASACGLDGLVRVCADSVKCLLHHARHHCRRGGGERDREDGDGAARRAHRLAGFHARAISSSGNQSSHVLMVVDVSSP